MNDGPDVCAGHFRRRVHVRDEPDGRNAALARGRRNGGGHVPELVNGRVGDAERAQFRRQIAQQQELFVGARVSGRGFVRLGVVPDVTEEAVQNRGHR